ncbi:MAG: glycosyltransferase family 39 protein [Actinobacteria bacterium]|nr:glycosyltransferase family 39 protein [Actinomycetota bacterium]
MAGIRRPGPEYALVLLLFLVLTIIFTWPLVLHLHNGVLGGHGDTLLNTWIMSWNAHALFSHPGSLFQGNIIYPSRDVLTYSEVMMVESLFAAPVYHAARNPVLAYNIVLVLGSVLGAFGCYLLIKELTGSRWGGIAGGVFFALCPYKMSKIGHLQIFFSPFLPFMILHLYRYLEHHRTRNLLLFGTFFLLQALSSWHYLVFCSLSAGLLCFWYALFARDSRQWSRLGLAVLVMFVAVAAMVPLAIPYFRSNARLPHFERTLDDSEYWSARPGDFLNVLPENLIYGSAPAFFTEGNILAENVLYPGLLVVILALAGILIRKRRGDDARVFQRDASTMKGYFALLIFVSVILMLGPRVGGVKNPFYIFLYHLGLLKFIRMPSRFFINAVLGLSVLCGYGIAKISLWARSWRNNLTVAKVVAGCLVLFLILEIATFNLTVYAVPVWGEVPDVYAWLEEQGDVRIIELPTLPLDNSCYDFRVLPLNPVDLPSYLFREGMLMYLSTYHWKKTVNGYSGYLPFFYKRIMSEMQGFPSRRTVDLLSALDIDYVIWHWNWVDEEREGEMRARLESWQGLERREDFDRITVYGVAKSGKTGAEGLQVSLLAPRVMVEKTTFNASLLVRNASESVFVSTKEERQECTVSFVDERGMTALAYRSRYPAPFFLEPGESTVLPIEAGPVPDEGVYELVLQTGDGVLPSGEYRAEVQTLPLAEAGGSGSMAGNVDLEGPGRIRIPVPDGLHPVNILVRNQGDILWRALRDEDDLLDRLPLGLVSLMVAWGMDGAAARKEEEHMLPGDLAPGEETPVPILVRPPDKPGTYELFVGLYDADIGWFGTPLTVEVEIEGSKELR